MPDTAPGPITASSSTGPTTSPDPVLVERIHAELLAVRKRPAGLSPTGMAALPTVVALLGDGDPLVAFTQLQDHILRTIADADDSLPIQAAAYSLGLASTSSTHLGRLTDFGAEYGFEARQARRHSDVGLQRLAHLIASSWTVQTTPQCRITLTGQPGGYLTLVVQCTWPWFVDMHPLAISQMCTDGRWTFWQPQPAFTPPADPIAQPGVVWLSSQLTQPLRLRRVTSAACASPGVARGTAHQVRAIRLHWRGEIWPQFVTTMTDLPPSQPLSVTTLGNTWILSLANVEVREQGSSVALSVTYATP